MTAVRGMRASDEDRQRVVDFLRDAGVSRHENLYRHTNNTRRAG